MLRGGKVCVCVCAFVLVCSPLSRFSPEPSCSIPFWDFRWDVGNGTRYTAHAYTHTRIYQTNLGHLVYRMRLTIDVGTLEGYIYPYIHICISIYIDTFKQPTIHADWNHLFGNLVTRIFIQRLLCANQKSNEKLRWSSFKVNGYS